MAEDKLELLNDLEIRVKQVMYLCDTFKDENIQLRNKLDSLKSLLTDKEEQLAQLTTKYESLKIARTITAASVDVDMAKGKLSRLVREIDKCISLLNI